METNTDPIVTDYYQAVEIIDNTIIEAFGDGAHTSHTSAPFTFANMLLARLGKADLFVVGSASLKDTH